MTDVMYLLYYITPQHCKFLISSLKLSFPVMLCCAPASCPCPPDRCPQRMANMGMLGTSKTVIWERAGTD